MSRRSLGETRPLDLDSYSLPLAELPETVTELQTRKCRMKPYKTFFILGVSLLALSIAAATHAGNAHISRRSLGGGGRAQSSAPAQGSSAAPVNTGDLPMPVDEI